MTNASDLYGLPVSNSGPALDVWLEGLHCADSFDASGIAELSKAVKLAPNFAIAHVALAKQQMFYGYIELSRTSLATARALSGEVTNREASLIQVFDATINFQSNALEIALTHLDQWPLDRFVFSLIVGPFGLLAFSGQRDWREKCLALLLHHQASWPKEDWWYLSALAFSKAECGFTAEAEDLGRRAWEQSANGNCTHSLSHIFKEQGNTTKGLSLIKTWLQGTQNRSNMRHHLVWHMALLDIESGIADQSSMDQLYRNELDPNISQSMPLDIYADNASFLWRCLLHDIPLNNHFVEQTLSHGKQYFPELGFGFADMHRVLLTALAGSESEVFELRSAIAKLENHDYLGSLLDGMLAFTQRDFSATSEQLKPLLDDTILLGGSNPQRGIIAETYQMALNHG